MTTPPSGASDTIISNIKRIKRKRKITNEQLAALMRNTGYPIRDNAVAYLLGGRRIHVHADELVALATALDLHVDTLLVDLCEHCDASPPRNMFCGTCGAGSYLDVDWRDELEKELAAA